MYRFITSIKKCDFQLLYSSSPINQKHHILSQLGPLQQVFKKFIETEQNTIPLENAELIELFDSCMDITKDVEELTEILQKIAPGNKRVGFHQINLIVDNLRTRLRKYLQYKGYTLDLIPHDHAFGSGGDFIKTIHATTSASIVVAPLMTMCKTGTINVTSLHGSDQAMTEIGYNQISIKPYLLKDLLVKYNFAFVSLGDMGLPYSDVLKKARKKLWEKNLEEINSRYRPEDNNWQKVVRNLNIPYPS
jgi:anthranilate phosphoribosyltransferase